MLIPFFHPKHQRCALQRLLFPEKKHNPRTAFRAYTCAIIDCWYITCMGAVEGFVCHVLLFAIMSLLCTLLLQQLLRGYAQTRAFKLSGNRQRTIETTL